MKRTDFENVMAKLGLDKVLHEGLLPGTLPAVPQALPHSQLLTVNYPAVDSSGVPKIRFVKAETGAVEQVVAHSEAAFLVWRNIPAPKRGEFVRQIGNRAREYKAELAYLISLESGKLYAEALGEVQEWIDVCDFAVGLSRQLYGLTMASERPEHHLRENWHPLGPVLVITAFNFPMAVWAWNAMLGFVCGNSILWKPSEKTPLCAAAIQQLVNHVLAEFSQSLDLSDKKRQALSSGLSSVVLTDAKGSAELCARKEFPLVSATGSVVMGRAVAATVGARLGKILLELGGNNALVVAPSANIDLALRAVVFSAVGTAGQRCTSLRRLILHESIAEEFLDRLSAVYSGLKIGDPFVEGNHLGPLVDERAFEAMQTAITDAISQGGEVVYPVRLKTDETDSLRVEPETTLVQPVIIKMPASAPILQAETFAPILYAVSYDTLNEAIGINNDVPQGLSSAIFTENMREAEQFMTASGSDCGITNVNIGTSGAEIGGAFGGEKETGGGRESGSDAWKNYMRRSTNTVNFGEALPLSQGIKFDI